jgi:uncharacterized membrane protein YkoI
MKLLCSVLCLAIGIGCGSTAAIAKGQVTTTVAAKVSKENAQKTALKLVPGEILCWDLQIEDGIPEYGFYIRGKDGRISEAEMDGNSGENTNVGVLLESQTRDGSHIKTTNAADLARLKQTKLTREQTQKLALKAYPGTVEAWELLLWQSGKEGRLVFDFRIAGKRGKRVVTIDSKAGAVVSITTYVNGQGR